MNAPFRPAFTILRMAELHDPAECARIERFLSSHADATVFHTPRWLAAVEAGTGQLGLGLLAERDGEVAGWLPLTEVHSPLFGRVLASTGFAVEGGAIAVDDQTALRLCSAAAELAGKLSCTGIELRGGIAPSHWQSRQDSHCGFVRQLAPDDDTELLAIPRKQRAEVRKGLANELEVSVGRDAQARAEHYAIYAQSVRNLGTPVFPRSLFDAVLDRLDSDILTISSNGRPVASVLSLYHRGAVLPYWGGGVPAARALRANDRMYFELMRHARQRGCSRFDFGRSKTESGAYSFKKNWGFEPQPLAYSSWTAPGASPRDADPNSPRHAARIAVWKRLPLGLANRLGPLIARGLG